MPLFNERAHINPIVHRVLAQPCVCQLIIVDDHSTDGSGAEVDVWAVRDPRVLVLRHSLNQGKGAAIQTGLQHVRAPFAVIQDADLEYDPADYAPMLDVLAGGQADVVYGSRFLRKQKVTWRWHRAANWILTWASNRCTGLRLTDAHTCLKMAPVTLFRSLALKEQRFGFCPEFTAKLGKIVGLRVAEVPVSYQPRQWGQGKKIGFRDGIRAIYCCVRYGLVPGKRTRSAAQDSSGVQCGGGVFVPSALRKVHPTGQGRVP